jgi:hypothetical protein
VHSLFTFYVVGDWWKEVEPRGVSMIPGLPSITERVQFFATDENSRALQIGCRFPMPG